MENQNPGTQVEAAVEYCLDVASTWLAWDGRPHLSDGGDRIYTPHKAVRRIADHLIDHLAEVEALLADVPTEPDSWHAKLVTIDADWARFTGSTLTRRVNACVGWAEPSRSGSPPPGRRSGIFPVATTGRCARSPNTCAASAGTPIRWAP